MMGYWSKLGKNFRRVQLPQHILLLIGLISIVMGGSSPWWLLIVYPAWFVIGHYGFGIIIHKYYCHSSFTTAPWIARSGAFLGMLSGTGSPIMTRAHHVGEHHAHVDTPQDPHSPIHGRMWSYFMWVNHEWNFTKPRIIRDMLKDSYLRFFHKNYYSLYWGSWLILAAFSWELAVFTISASTVLKFHQDGIVNTWGHKKHWGSYQNYTEGSGVGNSQNIPWLNWLTLGLGLHNNHHAKPWLYDYAHRRGEFDIARWIVPLISTDSDTHTKQV